MTALQKTKQAELIYLICFLMVTNPRRPTIARAQAELRRATGTWALEPADVERMWPGHRLHYRITALYRCAGGRREDVAGEAR